MGRRRAAPAANLEERFMRVMPEAPPVDDAPWLWRGLANRQGYGVVAGGCRTMLAHRFSYERFVGPIPPGMIVRHKNDIPLDINPRNLELGTRADNNRDTAERGRWNIHGRRNPVHGEGHPAAKVTEETVREIRRLRAAGMTYKAIGGLVGLSDNQCSLIVRRKNWAHVA